MHDARSAASSDGFALVEVLVALGLLSVGLLAAAGLATTGLAALASGRRETTALALAQTIVEDLHGCGVREALRRIPSAACDPGRDAACTLDPADAPELARFVLASRAVLGDPRGTVRLAALGGPTLDDAPAVRLDVEVRWTDGARPRSIELCTVRR